MNKIKEHQLGILYALLSATIYSLHNISIRYSEPYLTANNALAYLPSPKMGVISMTEVALGAFSGFALFNESLSWRSFFGAILIIGSGVRLNLPIPPTPSSFPPWRDFIKVQPVASQKARFE